MSNKKNPSFVIGAFIVGATILSFALLIFFSGGNMFTDKERIIMYFDGSVQGLVVGAPIKLKGVVVGEITDIRLHFQNEEPVILTMVSAELVMKRIHKKGTAITEEFFEESIKNGLRAQLNYQSFLTGLLYVELDFSPNTPLKLYKLQDDYIELPTVSTPFEEITKTIQELNLKGVVKNIDGLILQARNIVDSGQIQATLTSVSTAADSITVTSENLNKEVLQFNNTRKELDVWLKELNKQTPEIANQVNSNLVELQKTLVQFNKAADTINNTFAEDTPLVNQLNSTLEEVSRSAKAFRSLSETLEQQPESLLRGKQIRDEE
ncbi:MAG: MlaD family protein [Cellvibrio sp.]|uniref:MlaD family protein n=1 Tax=Cellvibrio sp. TaxID=1965322 RepID=UPI00319FB867